MKIMLPSSGLQIMLGNYPVEAVFSGLYLRCSMFLYVEGGLGILVFVSLRMHIIVSCSYKIYEVNTVCFVDSSETFF